MSPEDAAANPAHVRFPRVSGDEPAKTEEAADRIAFSPRERG